MFPGPGKRRGAGPAIVVNFLGFDRHRLVRLSLGRVLRFLPEGWTLKVWQDGNREVHSGRVVGDETRIRRNLDYFASHGLDVAHEPGVNRGTALTYWEAERWSFETMQADASIFIEDDIIISKHFFEVMAGLAQVAVRDARVGAFSAFGDPGADWVTQWRQRRRLQPMHHRWGFGITRDYWLRTRNDFNDYLSLLDGHDYRGRPNGAISDWISGLRGAKPVSHITSQDGARTAIMLKLGCFSMMTTPSYAVNIGKAGMHFQPQFYRQHRARMKGGQGFFPWPVRPATKLTDADAHRLGAESRQLVYW